MAQVKNLLDTPKIHPVLHKVGDEMTWRYLVQMAQSGRPPMPLMVATESDLQQIEAAIKTARRAARDIVSEKD